MRKALPVILLASLWSGSVMADLSDRVATLERRVESVTRTMLDVEQLKKENADLRGQVELLQHQIEQLKNQQRELYLDMERRLSGGEAAPPESAAPPPAPAPSTAAPGPGATMTEEQAYKAAYDLLVQQRRIPEAIAAFETFLREYPGGAYSDNAQFWLGEARYAGQDYGGAVKEFQLLVEQYPQSPKVPDALLKVGYIRYAQGDSTRAREVFEGVVRHYPGTAAARLAGQRLATMGGRKAAYSP